MSTKNGIRYRFYVSSALLRGRKGAAGSLARIPAAEIEDVVVAALKSRGNGAAEGPVLLADMLERVPLAKTILHQAVRRKRAAS